MKVLFALTILLGILDLGQGQLIGSRGILVLPDGVVYRDAETVSASEMVGRFARSFQREADSQAEQNRRFGKQNSKAPRFFTSVDGMAGRRLNDVEVFDFVDSRYIDPLPDTKFNKPLEEVEIERATPPTRLLPENVPLAPSTFTHLTPFVQSSSFIQTKPFAQPLGPAPSPLVNHVTPFVHHAASVAPGAHAAPVAPAAPTSPIGTAYPVSAPHYSYSSDVTIGGPAPSGINSPSVLQPSVLQPSVLQPTGNYNFFTFNNNRILY